MSKRTYPHYAGKERGNPRWAENDVKCEACTTTATCYATVQWSWFRGDDESYRVCDDCLVVARTDIQKFTGIVEARRAVRRAGLSASGANE